MIKKKITISDIAVKANVSKATVSNVLNGNNNKVSVATRELITKIMKEYDYQPSITARSLSTNKSDLIALLLPITDNTINASLLLRDNPFYAELISGIEFEAVKFGYDVIIKGIRPGESCHNWIKKRAIDGAVFIGNFTEVIVTEMKYFNCPLVLIDCYDSGTDFHSGINIDDDEAGYFATKQLLLMGHRNIALATENNSADGPISRRYLGYLKAMKEYKIENVDNFVFYDNLTFNGGYSIGKKMLENKGISAVFCCADIVAFGIMKAYKEAGKKLPQDLSVIGFDDISSCQFSEPRLTSIKQPIFEKGALAIRKLNDLIVNPQTQITKTVLPITLVKRESAIPVTKKGISK